jgi:LPXTG-site transpeptidase (sortase) family protein
MLGRPALSGVTAVGLALALFVLYALYGTALLEQNAQRSLRAQFRADAAASATANPGRTRRVLARLSIPTIGLDAMVPEGDTPEAIARGPELVPPLPMSSRPPAVVIVGHRTTHGAVFRHLGDLKPGDQVTLRTTRGVDATYVVERKTIVSPGTHLESPDGVQRIYLVTATPAYSAGQRLIVVGRRTDVGAAVAPLPPPVPLPALSGSSVSAVFAILALAALFFLMAARSLYASVWSRTARRAAWLVAVVIDLAAWQFLLGSLSPLA